MACSFSESETTLNEQAKRVSQSAGDSRGRHRYYHFSAWKRLNSKAVMVKTNDNSKQLSRLNKH